MKWTIDFRTANPSHIVDHKTGAVTLGVPEHNFTYQDFVVDGKHNPGWYYRCARLEDATEPKGFMKFKFVPPTGFGWDRIAEIDNSIGGYARFLAFSAPYPLSSGTNKPVATALMRVKDYGGTFNRPTAQFNTYSSDLTDQFPPGEGLDTSIARMSIQVPEDSIYGEKAVKFELQPLFDLEKYQRRYFDQYGGSSDDIDFPFWVGITKLTLFDGNWSHSSSG